VAHEPNKEEQKLSRLVDVVQRVVYYAASALLAVTIVMVFVSTVTSMLRVLEVGVPQTALTVLDQMLLIFIFVELLDTIGIVAREQEIVAEPFLLIGIIAVVRRILSVTAEAGQTAIGTEEFRNLTTELGVLAALVVGLGVALYVTRRTRRRERSLEDS
jgi:uncharacterized membrane protein (DUF373 family)